MKTDPQIKPTLTELQKLTGLPQSTFPTFEQLVTASNGKKWSGKKQIGAKKITWSLTKLAFGSYTSTTDVDE